MISIEKYHIHWFIFHKRNKIYTYFKLKSFIANYWNLMGFFVVFYFNFCGDKSPFCGATGALCFRHQLTLPMGFKARVDPSSPTLCSHLHIIIFSQLWISRPGHVPILHLGMVRLLLEWPPNVTSRITGRDRIRTQDLMAQSPADTLLTELSWPGLGI